MHRLSAMASGAGGLPVPGLWRGSCLDDGAGTVSVRRLSAAELADRRDDFRGYAQAPARLASAQEVMPFDTRSAVLLIFRFSDELVSDQGHEALLLLLTCVLPGHERPVHRAFL